MGKRIAVVGLIAISTLVAGNFAHGAVVQVGKLVLRADGGFEPRLLPKDRYAPIKFQGYGKISTTDGSVPPALRHVELEFDRDGLLTTAGLPVCQPGRIEGTSPSQARRRCHSAIVGTGHLKATVAAPGFERINVESPLTLFNGPRQGGNPTVVGHAQVTFPATETHVVTVPIERRRGLYRYRAAFDVPPIAGGYGSLIYADAKIGRRYTAGGVERSYVSARCSDYILQTRGFFSFADGTVIYGSAFKVCAPR